MMDDAIIAPEDQATASLRDAMTRLDEFAAIDRAEVAHLEASLAAVRRRIQDGLVRRASLMAAIEKLQA
jgi:hypothetical protein